ncbi:MAG: hypothetical protein NW215_09810 [Hyphomicrobiales bacterium]|nr:hypothetical protein [Hyphomicrobiales bacterium]
MAEPIDVILPILQRIQADIAEIRREQKEHRGETAELNERLEALSGYITYQMGLTSSHKVDIEAMQVEMNEIK